MPEAVPFLYGPMEIAARMPCCAWNIQCVQPVFASSANTAPLSLPTNSRPPATAGWARAELTPGKPNAHLSVSFGTDAAERLPRCAGTNRVLAVVEPQPFQPSATAAAVRAAGFDVQRPTSDTFGAVPTGRPAMNPATARRSASVSAPPCWYILPLISDVRIASGAFCDRISRVGARDPAAGAVWQLAHDFS